MSDVLSRLKNIDGMTTALESIYEKLTQKQKDDLRLLYSTPLGVLTSRDGNRRVQGDTISSCSRIGTYLTDYFDGVGSTTDKMMWIGFIASDHQGNEYWVMRDEMRSALKRAGLPVRFHDENGNCYHNQFQKWREKHPDGIFLTLESRTKANLHGAQCQHLGSRTWPADDTGLHSLTKKEKILSEPGTNLYSWANQNSIEVHLCSHCVRDGYIDETFASESAPESSPESTGLTEAMEGLVREVTVLSRVRNGALRHEALKHAKGICEVCTTNFSEVLGGLGVRALQVHHRQQLALEDIPRLTRLEDLAVVCANCHALIHMNPKHAHTVEELRNMLEQQSDAC
jgi:hypothetical protein